MGFTLQRNGIPDLRRAKLRRRHAQIGPTKRSGSLAIFAAIRRASPRQTTV